MVAGVVGGGDGDAVRAVGEETRVQRRGDSVRTRRARHRPPVEREGGRRGAGVDERDPNGDDPGDRCAGTRVRLAERRRGVVDAKRQVELRRVAALVGRGDADVVGPIREAPAFEARRQRVVGAETGGERDAVEGRRGGVERARLQERLLGKYVFDSGGFALRSR